VCEREPEGEGNRRGERLSRKAKHLPRGTLRSTEQSLEAEASERGSRLAGERADDNGMGARPGDEPGTAVDRENPLDGGTLDVAAGRNKPAKPIGGVNRREVEKTCGRTVAGVREAPATSGHLR
jgi:hypothetical protein